MQDKFIYMAVTNDKYELPVYWFESAAELARFLNIKPETVREIISRNKPLPTRLNKKKIRYIKVKVSGDSD